MIQKVNELEIKEVTEEEYIEVLKWLFGENIEIFKEKDITLSKVYENPYMYYTKEINDLIQTKFMQRSKKILQLGTTNLEIPTSSNNRLQHAKGAAYRCLEFYAIQFRKSEWKHYIETNNLKKYLVEKLKYMYCHDIGHSMQSHSIEKVIGDIKCNHEIIGKKICLEDKEVVNALSNIKADESTSQKEMEL